MRLSKISRLLLGLGILVITLGSLGVARSQQLSEGKKLSDELAVAQLRLTKLDLKDLYSQQEQLNSKLSKADLEMQTARAALSLPNDSVTISEAIFRIAQDAGVEVIRIGSTSLSSAKLSGANCVVLPISALVRGEEPNLIDFVMRLNRDFPIGVVNSVGISIARMPAGTTASVILTDNTTSAGTDNITIVVTDNTTIAVTDNVTAPVNSVPSGNNLDARPSAQVQLSIYTYSKGK